MPRELEAKVKVESLDEVRLRLVRVGAARQGSAGQVNRFYDTPDRSLAARGSGLRIRIADNGSSLTFKGPFEPGPFKSRQEWETGVDDPEAMEGILQGLGYGCTFEFRKSRETWKLDGCLVELDEVPELGLFVEVEGPDEPAIRAVLAKVELDRHAVIRSGYVELLIRARGGRP